MRYIQLLLVVFLTFSCVERYNFTIKDEQKNVVIEALITDKSFTETLSYPSDGRYFSVKLTYTSDVTNTRPELIPSAQVKLESSNDEVWNFTETETGIYKLFNNEFKAEKGTSYRLTVSVNGEDSYESDWETLPEVDAPEIGEVGFKESEIQAYVVEANENVLRTIKGITPYQVVKENNTGSSIYYRWTYQPMWVFRAPLSSVVDPGHLCWVTNPLYLNTFELEEDRSGGYNKDLFFIPTIRNERIFEDFSLLLIQHSTSKDVFNFWKEMKDRNEAGGLNNVPPYNLKTNFHSIGKGKKVYGYFNVVSEQAKRWYFNIKDLSYKVENTLQADCQVSYGPGPPARQCTDCRGYAFGEAVNVRPVWWRK